MAEKSIIGRGYAGPAGRQIHYRIAGSGPPLVLFHQSPRSSGEYEALIRRWSADFTVIAPDTPGYGASDPLASPDVPEMNHFADAMVGFFDDLGLAQTSVYGFHTGASLAVALTCLAPERVASAVANGFALLEPNERDEFLANYLPPFVPKWDGSHLTYLWARIREQVIFFPWYEASNAARMVRPPYTPEALNDQVLDMLSAGDHYRRAYRAAFAFDKAAALADIKGKLTIMAAASDPLADHLDRLPEMPKGCGIERLATNEAAINRAEEILRAADLPDFSLISAATNAGNGIIRGYVDANGELIHYRRAGTGDTVILLHDILSGSRVLEAEIEALAKDFDVIALDLPLHGQSHGQFLGQSDGRNLTPATCAGALAGAIDTLNLGQVKVMSFGHGATVAAALVERLNGQVSGLIFADATFPNDSYRNEYSASFMPDLAHTPHGGHLLAGWRFARSQALFWPWFRDDIPGIRPVDDAVTSTNTHTRFVALWECAAVWECAARQKPLAPEWFIPPERDATWLSPDWAEGMEGMNSRTGPTYPGDASAARLAALSRALRD